MIVSDHISPVLADLRFAAEQLAKAGLHDAAARLDNREERVRDAMEPFTGKRREAYARHHPNTRTAPASPAGLACTVPPEGWWCSRQAGHDGPCAAMPDTGDKLVDLIRSWMMSDDYPVSKWECDFAAAIRALTANGSRPDRVVDVLREARVYVSTLAMYDGEAPLEDRFVSVPAVVARRAKGSLARIDTALSTGRQA